MLVLLKQMLRADIKPCARVAGRVRYEYIGQELFGRTLGLVGMGRIGSRVAEICHFGFNMPVIYYDVLDYPQLEEKLAARKVTLAELLLEADYISVHVPLLPSTSGMLGREQFARMKPGAIVINTSRWTGAGRRQPLGQALKSGHLGGAGLDVYAVEPTPVDNPLFQLENVVLSPHMAAHTDDALKAMSMIAEDVLRVLEGQEPLYRVA